MDRAEVIIERIVDSGLWRMAEAEHVQQDQPVALAERLKIMVPDLVGAGKAWQKYDRLF